MTFTSNADIEHIYSGIIARTLPKPEWTHAAHWAAAVAILSDKKQTAFEDMPQVIKAYNLATGVKNTDTDGYHHTITLASLRAAKSVMAAPPLGGELFEITNVILTLEFGKPNWLLTYWSKEVLFSVKARRDWVEPDIKALPL